MDLTTGISKNASGPKLLIRSRRVSSPLRRAISGYLRAPGEGRAVRQRAHHAEDVLGAVVGEVGEHLAQERIVAGCLVAPHVEAKHLAGEALLEPPGPRERPQRVDWRAGGERALVEEADRD